MDVHVCVHDPEFSGAYQPKSQKVDLRCQLPSPQVKSLEVDRVVQSGVWRVATCLVLPSHHHTHYSTPPGRKYPPDYTRMLNFPFGAQAGVLNEIQRDSDMSTIDEDGQTSHQSIIAS